MDHTTKIDFHISLLRDDDNGYRSGLVYTLCMIFPVTEPLWVPESRLSLLQPDHQSRRLLTDSGSLTRKIMQHCSGPFSVKVLHQHYTAASHGEREILKLPSGQSTHVRAVHLYCKQTPWVFAHTVIPHHSLRRSLRRLTQLGNRSLGAILHNSRLMERSHVEYARFEPHHTLYQQATAHLKRKPPQLWGRRILYRIENNPILVHELFLPTFI